MSTTFLFDMSNIIYSTAISHFTKTGDQFDADLLRGIFLTRLKDMRRVLKVKPYDELVLVFDGPTYWRREIFPHYKANRKKNRDKIEMDWAAFFSAYETVKSEFFAVSPWKCIQVDRAEADDVIAVLARRLATTKPVMIVSSDKDFLQLQSKGLDLKQWSLTTGKILKKSEYNLFEHIVRGDTGDGIPNILSAPDSFVAGKRQKSIFAKDLEEWSVCADPGDFCRDMEMLGRYDLNRRLIDLSCIPDDVAMAVVEAYESTKPVFGKLSNYVISNRLMRILPI